MAHPPPPPPPLITQRDANYEILKNIEILIIKTLKYLKYLNIKKT